MLFLLGNSKAGKHGNRTDFKNTMQARAAHQTSGITKNLVSILLNTAAKNLIKWDDTVQLEVDINFINLSCAALHL